MTSQFSLMTTLVAFFVALSASANVQKVTCRHDARPSDGDLQEIQLIQSGSGYAFAYHISKGGIVPQPNPDETLALSDLSCRFAKSNRAVFACDDKRSGNVMGVSSIHRVSTGIGFGGKEIVDDSIEISVLPMTTKKVFSFDVTDCTVQ